MKPPDPSTPEINTRLAMLRRWLHEEPCAQTALQIFRCLGQWPAREHRALGLEYALPYLQQWPAELRPDVRVWWEHLCRQLPSGSLQTALQESAHSISPDSAPQNWIAQRSLLALCEAADLPKHAASH